MQSGLTSRQHCGQSNTSKELKEGQGFDTPNIVIPARSTIIIPNYVNFLPNVLTCGFYGRHDYGAAARGAPKNSFWHTSSRTIFRHHKPITLIRRGLRGGGQFGGSICRCESKESGSGLDAREEFASVFARTGERVDKWDSTKRQTLVLLVLSLPVVPILDRDANFTNYYSTRVC
ncbi:hypothetical protein GEV33_000659 [Tenebrio molitor]|jgi:hypothetical protein|uniref:Uncharacterized protein n=1 Tax=Tenebrio molitor TaxID=7067 RepID=A0A8J6HXP4_TENMO|nr:hypothetical protein GEV33_000659 [Tenebrio molitor]